jgi:hypothetical protein
MPIQQIGDRGVYVISAEVPTATTSRGEGYAQYVTNLRWKLWEEVQKDVLANLEFDKLAFAQQAEYYNQMSKELTGEIGKIQKLISDVEEGKIKSAEAINKENVKNLLSRDIQQAKIENSFIPTVSTSITQGGSGTDKRATESLTGDSKDSFTSMTQAIQAEDPTTNEGIIQALQASETFQTGAAGNLEPSQSNLFRAATVEKLVEEGISRKIPEAEMLERIGNVQGDIDFVGQYLNRDNLVAVPGAAKTTTRTTMKVGETPTIPEPDKLTTQDRDALLKQLRDEKVRLETQLGTLQAPTPPSADILEKSRQRFASAYGTGGFGQAPRVGKVAPRFDEVSSLENAKAILDYAKANNIPAENVLSQLGGRQITRQDFLSKPFEPRQPASLAPTPGRPLLRENLVQQLGVEEVAPAAPTTTDAAVAPVAPPEPPVSSERPVRAGVPVAAPVQAVEEAPVSRPAVGMLAPPAAAVAPVAEPGQAPAAPAAPVIESTGPRRVESEVLEDAPAPILQRVGGGLTPSIVPAPQPDIRREQAPVIPAARPSVPGFDLSGLEALRRSPQPDLQGIITPTGEATEEGIRQAVQGPGTLEEQLLDAKELYNRVRQAWSRGELNNEAAVEKSKIIEEAINELTQEIEKKSPQLQKEFGASRREKQNQDILNTYESGVALANQPKKFNRIAKKDIADPIERSRQVANYVNIVEQLYKQTARTGGDAFKSTYDELQNAFEGDELKRANEYLVAYDTLENNIV